MKTVLLVSSSAMEFSGLTRRFTATPLNWPLDFAREISVNEQRWLLVANGAGFDRATECFDVARKHAQIDAVVSTGYCGALDPALHAADVVVGTAVHSAPNHIDAAAAVAGAKRGAVYAADHVVASSREKRQIRQQTGAATVDMESHALAQAAAKAGIPFHCIRAVTDVAEEELHIDFNAARDASGRIDARRAVMAALRQRPLATLPELGKLAYRAWKATNQLGDFLASCRFS